MFNLSIYNGCIVDKRTIVVPYKKFTNLYHQLLLRLEAIDCWSSKVPYDAFTVQNLLGTSATIPFTCVSLETDLPFAFTSPTIGRKALLWTEQ